MLREEMSARVVVAACLLALLALLPLGTADTLTTTTIEEEDRDDESDSAPFAMLLEHSDGRRCGASLVSLRTGLTAAACARQARPARAGPLWALSAAGAAPRADSMRRVIRVATAARVDIDAEDVIGSGWSGAVSDLALIELEEPFGASARVRPILMATARGECEAAAAVAPCHAVHAVRAVPADAGAGQRMRLRIVDVLLAPAEKCAAAASHWPAVRDRALCLTGPDFCENDRGIGIVCGGKLCGVLSRSVRASGAGDGVDEHCGDTHAAQGVSRWRRFLHCAHTLRLCGRGECADLCVERRLLDEDDESAASRSNVSTATESVEDRESTTAWSATHAALTFSLSSNASSGIAHQRSTRPAPARTTIADPPLSAPSHRPAFEFEPNRADFKAGEYGDNGAEYGGEEPVASATRTSATAPPVPHAPSTGAPAEQRLAAAPVAPHPYLEIQTSGVGLSRTTSNILYETIIYMYLFV